MITHWTLIHSLQLSSSVVGMSLSQPSFLPLHINPFPLWTKDRSNVLAWPIFEQYLYWLGEARTCQGYFLGLRCVHVCGRGLKRSRIVRWSVHFIKLVYMSKLMPVRGAFWSPVRLCSSVVLVLNEINPSRSSCLYVLLTAVPIWGPNFANRIWNLISCCFSQLPSSHHKFQA